MTGDVLAQFDADVPAPGFLCRRGPLYEQHGQRPLQIKLCFTSTRMEPMAEVLYELSQRRDCVFVKMDKAPLANGMVRGRCFMETPEAVAEVWRQYKITPDLLCTIQDDYFTLPHRQE